MIPSDKDKKDTIAFIAVTNYHIQISYILRNSFPNHKKILIINGILKDSSKLKDKIIQTNHWDKVLLVACSSKDNNFAKFRKVYEYIILKLRVKRILNELCINEVVIFTMGDLISNLFSGSKSLHKVYMSEDGTYPYYGGLEMYDVGSTLHKMMYGERNSGNQFALINLISRFKSMFKKLFFNEFIINLSKRVDAIILLKPELFNNSFDKFKKPILTATLDNIIVNKSFNQLEQVFEYKENPVYQFIDIIFFDSGMVSANVLHESDQIDLTFKLLTNLIDPTKKILIKPSPYSSEHRLEQLRNNIDRNPNFFLDEVNLRIPWELIYFKNQIAFRDVTIASFRSTACISPYIFFSRENDLMIFSKFVSNNLYMTNEDKIYYELFQKLIENLCDIFKHKKIYFPVTSKPFETDFENTNSSKA